MFARKGAAAVPGAEAVPPPAVPGCAVSVDRRSPAVDGHILRVDDELAELQLLRGPRRGVARPSGAGRLRGPAPVAQALGIHPQTARQRLRRLEALFGDRLTAPLPLRGPAGAAHPRPGGRRGPIPGSHRSRAVSSKWSRTRAT
ncbi:helix-turn-helix domain-containing protein [Streptomyces sp. NPDC008086]|uniref:helix-turn-helix domain-containing protein n=1 Tax=Streptomyces sp. NPDC008086 TaxID=3364807 RepID=UPI0036E35D6E